MIRDKKGGMSMLNRFDTGSAIAGHTKRVRALRGEA